MSARGRFGDAIASVSNYNYTHAVCINREAMCIRERLNFSNRKVDEFPGGHSMGRQRVNISVSAEALELLERLQGRMGLNRSALLELLVREEAARRRISLPRRQKKR